MADKERKLLDTNMFSYAITKLGEKLNLTFVKGKNEITEDRIDDILASVFDEEDNNNG